MYQLLYLNYKIWCIIKMEQQQSQGLSFDIQFFGICQFCFRLFFILLLEVYILFLYCREMIKLQDSNYDRLDISFFTISIVCLVTDIISSLIFGIGISEVELLLKVIWSLTLFLIFLRFIFRKRQCTKYFAIILGSLTIYYVLSMYFFKIVPIRYSLMFIFSGIIVCCVYHFFCINELINHEKARQRELKVSIQYGKDHQARLLDKRQELQYTVLSSDVKYHLYLRRSFCMVMGISLAVQYFFLWNLQESRNSLGEFFLIIVIQIIPIMVYYFFTCANQWLIQQLNPQQTYKQIQLQNLASKSQFISI